MNNSMVLLRKNLKILERSQPRLVARLQEYIEGLPSLREPFIIETPSGRWIEGLTEEAFFEKNSTLEKKVMKKKTGAIFMVFGIGCPPYLFNVLRSLPKDVLSVIIVDPSVDLLLHTLSQTSVFHVLPDGCRISFIVHEDRSLIDEAFEYNLIPIGIFPIEKAEVIVHSSLEDRESLRSLYKFMKEEMLYRLNMLGNSPEDTLLGIRHGFLNVQSIIKSPSINLLKELYLGKPFICVATGPSLEKNVDLLKGNEDKCVIVACDTVLLSLLKRGICPHVVTTIERPFLNYEVFLPQALKEFPEECKRILLFSQSVSHPLMAGRWPGPNMIVGKLESPADKWLVGHILQKQVFLSGMSVAHMAFSFAAAMEASSIAFIGQDLAFSDTGASHARGALSEEVMDAERRMERIKVPGALGGEVETHRLWVIFLQIFERYISHVKDKIPVFDCTEGGALIKGTVVMPLEQYLYDYVFQKNLQKANVFYADVLLPGFPISSEDIEGCIKRMQDELEILRRIELLLDEIEETVQKAGAPAIAPAQRQGYASKVAGMIDDCHRSHPVLSFIGQSYTYSAGGALAKSRFMETSDAVHSWMTTHKEILQGHRVNMRFLRQWIDFGLNFLQHHLEESTRQRQFLSASDVEQAFKELSESENFPLHEHDIFMITDLLNKWDLGDGDWEPVAQWNAARCFKMQGRVFEARRLMTLAFGQLQGRRDSLENIVSFFDDWIELAVSHDLCEYPQFNLALSLLETVSELIPEEESQLLEMRHKVLRLQHEFFSDVQKASSESSLQYFTIQTYRNKAEDALISKNLVEALSWVELLVFEGISYYPVMCAPYLNWLVKTASQCLNAENRLIATASRRIIKRIADEQDRFAGFSIVLPSEILFSLGKDV